MLNPLEKDAVVSSPGMKYQHYSPKAQLSIVRGNLSQFISYVNEHKSEADFVLCFEGEEEKMPLPSVTFGTSDDSFSQAKRIFDALRELDEKGALTFTVGENEIVLAPEDLLIGTVQKEGFQAESDNGITVVLDTNLTPELIEEGFVRELVSKIQTMRKDAGFEVMDTIKIYVSGNEKIEAIFNANKESVCGDVLATDIIASEGGSFAKEWDINGEKVTLGVEKN